MKITRGLLLASGVAGALSASAPANALTFVLNNTGGTEIGTNARNGFEAAAYYWSQILSDDITVTLDIGFQSLDPGVLGSTTSSALGLFTDTIYDQLLSDVSSALDISAVSTLRPLGPSTDPDHGALTALTNEFADPALRQGYTDTGIRLDDDGSTNNFALAVNTANLKALGFSGGPLDGVDGSIVFSSNFGFDFDPRDGVSAGTFDFIGVAIHEIGHALGFVSGVDTYDIFTQPNGPGGICLPAGTCVPGLRSLEDSPLMSTLDLFRYGQAGLLDWSTADGVKYFSIDGGLTQFNGDSQMATGAYNGIGGNPDGDGDQASHWLESPSGQQRGIMDPTSAPGQRQEITALDLAAFDAMGWDLNINVLANPGYRLNTGQVFESFVPEPASWAMMIAGFGFIGASMRRARAREVSFAA